MDKSIFGFAPVGWLVGGGFGFVIQQAGDQTERQNALASQLINGPPRMNLEPS
jgi:hypothetical protein